MKNWILSALTLCVFTCASSAFAAASNNDSSEAKKVINSWFTAMKDGDINKAGTFLAPQFRSMHTDLISRDKAQEMELIKNLQMTKYKLDDFNISQSGDIIIVTFTDKGAELIDNKPISKQAAGRLAVLQKQEGKWLIVAYANLDPINPPGLELATPNKQK